MFEEQCRCPYEFRKIGIELNLSANESPQVEKIEHREEQLLRLKIETFLRRKKWRNLELNT